jgi:DNA primase
MNLDQAKQFPRVVITEGPIDCVHAGPDAVATFGKQISAVQIAKLIKAGVKAVDLMWDSDAVKEIQQFGAVLSSIFDTRLVYLPHGDPGDYSRDWLTYFRSQAQPVHNERLLHWV